MTTPTTATNPEQGPTFRAARQGAGVTVRALAKEAGVDYTHLSRWERGERPVSLVTYEHLSRALADYLAGKWTA